MKMIGDRCRCNLCGEHFNSNLAHSQHRAAGTGLIRRCLSPEQMTARGMIQTADGFWLSWFALEQALLPGRISQLQAGPTP